HATRPSAPSGRRSATRPQEFTDHSPGAARRHATDTDLRLGRRPCRARGSSPGPGGPLLPHRVRALHLHVVAAARHRAPATRLVAGGVVEGPPAGVTRADLEPGPGAILSAAADGVEETGQGVVPGLGRGSDEPGAAGAER